MEHFYFLAWPRRKAITKFSTPPPTGTNWTAYILVHLFGILVAHTKPDRLTLTAAATLDCMECRLFL